MVKKRTKQTTRLFLSTSIAFVLVVQGTQKIVLAKSNEEKVYLKQSSSSILHQANLRLVNVSRNANKVIGGNGKEEIQQLDVSDADSVKLGMSFKADRLLNSSNDFKFTLTMAEGIVIDTNRPIYLAYGEKGFQTPVERVSSTDYIISWGEGMVYDPEKNKVTGTIKTSVLEKLRGESKDTQELQPFTLWLSGAIDATNVSEAKRIPVNLQIETNSDDRKFAISTSSRFDLTDNGQETNVRKDLIQKFTNSVRTYIDFAGERVRIHHIVSYLRVVFTDVRKYNQLKQDTPYMRMFLQKANDETNRLTDGINVGNLGDDYWAIGKENLRMMIDAAYAILSGRDAVAKLFAYNNFNNPLLPSVDQTVIDNTQAIVNNMPMGPDRDQVQNNLNKAKAKLGLQDNSTSKPTPTNPTPTNPTPTNPTPPSGNSNMNTNAEKREIQSLIYMLHNQIYTDKNYNQLRRPVFRQIIELARERTSKLSDQLETRVDNFGKLELKVLFDRALALLDGIEATNNLFADGTNMELNKLVSIESIEDAQKLVDKMWAGPDKIKAQEKINLAQSYVAEILYTEKVANAVEKLFIDVLHDSLADTTDQNAIDSVKQLIDKLKDEEIRNQHYVSIDEAQRLLNGKYAIERLFTDKDKKTLKSNVDQKMIDEVQAVVNKMPGGSDRNEAQEDLNKAQEQVDRKNETAAKEETDKLFKDESHTSLADRVDQKAIDDAQKALDKVRDKDVKAKGQAAVDQAQKLLKAKEAVDGLFTDTSHTALKPETNQEALNAVKTQVSELAEGADKVSFGKALDQAQNILDGQKGTETLFSDKDKQVVKPSVDQQVIDDTQSVVDKMPKGPAKDRAQEDLNKAQEQVDRRNETAAKEATDKLFKDESHTSLADKVDQKAIDDAQQALDKVRDKDVKAKGQAAVDQAQKLLKAKEAVDGLFTDTSHTALKPETNQEALDAVKTQVSELAEGADKVAFGKALEKAQNILDGQKGIETLFSDEDKQIVKPSVDQQVIDDTQSVVDKMPKGPAKDQAQKDLNKAQEQVDRKNETAAKEATDKLFKDEAHTSLADKVDQKAIDDAQKALDKVRDKDVKAKGQKDLDNAQSLFNGQKGTETLFSDKDKQVVKPGVDQQVIDDTQSVVDKMPKGPAKDQAQEDLNKAQEQVDRRNETAAKEATDKLFKDESHTSLADKVDQKAIDDAQQALDKVRDKDVKAKGQAAVDQAQKLLKAKESVDGLFTDTSHTALKPETNQEALDAVKTQVSELAEGADKVTFGKALDKGQRILDGQKAVETLFSDKDKQVVKPSVDQQVIDDAQSVIYKMPAGPAKDQAQEDLNKAQEQVDRRNETAAKEAADKLFKDDTQTSLADNVNQKAIDDAQKALDKVRDKDVKAKGQKDLDNAQSLFNGQKGTETLFSDKDKQVVKPGVDQQVIDDTQSVVDKMPKGPAKDQAQEDLNKAQEQVDRRNETAAKEATDKLFKDEAHTSLADKVDQKAIDDAQKALDKVRDKDVKAKGQAAVDQAQKLLKAKEAVDGLFTDTSHTALKPETNQEALDAVKTQVSELAEGADKVAFGKALEKAQNILDGQKGTETLFSDEDKQVVKPGVDQQVIDDTQSVVDKMPKGPAKDQAQKDLNKAQEQVDRKNETAAKEATDKLFKDEAHTSLADKVDQKAIDDAQKALDKVRDKDVKAKGQKDLDNAQSLFNGQKGTETLFSDKDKQVVKPGVDQQVIDDTQSVVDKMPKGPAKDQAQEDLNKAQEQVDRRNETAAKEATDKLFKDESHTSLADKVDQKAIDDAQQALDKVRDKDVKAKGQAAVDQAQKLLKAKESVDGLFTDTSHTALKPETNQEALDAVKTQVSELAEGADKVTFGKALDKGQRILDGQKAVETLFSDKDKQVVKPSVDQQVIDDAQSVIYKMPAGPAKDQAQEDLNKAQEQVDRRNETAAKEAADKLFKDDTQTSLADNVNQKAIDDAQKALDKVRDKDVKAKGQKDLDNAQSLFNGQKGTETLFSDKDKQVVKPGVDQQVIDDTQSVVDKMPKGPAKDQAQEDLNKAQEQVDRRNETAAKEATDKLFKDEAHTSLADKVDQKAIDDAQKALDKVRDKDVKAKGQAAVDQAQKLLKAKEAVDGLFTDTSHTALKPETNQEALDAVKTQVSELAEGADKVAFGKALEKAQNILDGQKGTETLFSDEDKQVVKPGVDQQVIDDTQSVVDKMPKGPAKDQAQEDLNKAQEQVDRRNETAAKEATDKLFKDEAHTSLADNVNQKAIDDAQKALDKVRDKDVKAKGQKDLDNAQSLFNGQKGTETLFSDKDKQVVKPGVDQQVIDDTQSVVDKMPKGPAKDQAQEDLNKAQEQVDRRNETAAKEATDKLFKDEAHTSLADKVDQKAIDDAQQALDKVRDKDVKAKGQAAVDQAQKLLKAKESVDGLFTDTSHTALKPETNQEALDAVKTQVSELAEGADKVTFGKALEKAQNILDGQKGTETLFSDEDKQIVKPGVDQQVIDDTQSVVDKMPKGPAKDQAQKDLNKAQEQVDRKNETAAKEATDKLFKDESHTSLADNVNQKAIDDAQQALDKVRDKDVKAKGQKDLDNAQSLFNGQKGTETLFSDKDKQVVKPGVDQQVIDDTQSVVDKMPKGPAKDQAQEDLNKAQEQVDRRNETAAKEATDKLFKDESHTSLADKVDQKAIDDAQKALDKVRDKDVKAKGQAAVDQAQKLLKAKESVDGLFTDTSHTALKPETNQEALDAVKKQVSELAEGADKVAFGKALDKAQRILDGQKATETLFSDEDKQVVKPGVNQQVIDDTQSVVDKMPDGPVKDQAQKDLNKAQEQVDRRNETAAKKATDKLFKDESHTSLADRINQKAIDDAQQALDKVRDKGVKAKHQQTVDQARKLLKAKEAVDGLFTDRFHTALKPQTNQEAVDVVKTQVSELAEGADKVSFGKALDKAQRILDGQKAVETLFSDEDKQVVKLGVDQKVIDDVESVVDKMPDGPARDQAQEDLNKAQEQVDRKNETAAKEATDKLFKDESHTSLADRVDQKAIDDAQKALDKVRDKDVKAKGQAALDEAQKLLKAKEAVDGLFTDTSHTALKPETNQEALDAVKTQVSELAEGADKVAFGKALDKVQRILDGQKAIETLFSDTDKQVVKPDVDQKVIDDVESVVDKMPDGPARDQAQKDLDKARSQVEENHQTTAKEAIDNLFKDDTHTSLTDKVDQKSIDDAQQALDKVRDKDVKAKGQKVIDDAQSLFNGQKGIETLFSDKDKQVVKPGVDQKVIDDTQSVVDKMPDGPAKDQAQEDLNKAQEQVDRKNETAAKKVTDKLFKDESHTSLADRVDQKAIDDAQKALDKVRDKDVKAKGQAAVDQAQKLLKAKEAVDGLFTDRFHTVLKPETNQEALDAVKTQVSELAEGADKVAFGKALDKAQRILDGQKAIETLFSDTDKQVVKPGVDQQVIDDVESVVDKMPDGPARDQAQKDLVIARSQVEENNQTAAKEAIDKLFKDDTHTSLADNVDQKAIDDAQQALDKVRDKGVKAKGQKVIDDAQSLFNGQKGTETLFSDEDKQVVKPGVDQQVIDDTQSVVDKMPAGPAKDQAQEDLNKAQEQVDRRNETAAKEATDKLFKDESHTSLADKVDQKAIDDAQQALDKVRDKDVKAKGQAAVDQAQKLLKAKEAVDGLFTDTSHTALKPETNQEALDAVKTQVSELAEGADKVAFGKALDKAQRILDGQKATETLFSDEDKQVVKPGVDQQVIDDTQSVVDKMPKGSAKDQAQEDLSKAQEQVDRKNETAAKEATDKLFKDESHTSLADKVDQKAIDDAQQALDKVRDKGVKAKGQKVIDDAQSLFNGQKGTETLFSDEDKQVVKPGVDQQVIDDTQSVVDKMPDGPAKDQAQEDLSKAQEQVDRKNETAAKEATDKLFKDESHTSLADKVDQKAIDDAQQALDKVRDKDVKAKHQQTVDRAQKLLKAKEAVDGLFTDTSHTALKPETNQEALDAVKKQVSELAEGADKVAFGKALDKAQRILDGQKAIETLFSDTDKQVVKPGVDQQVIDDTQSVVDKMPKGPARDQAQKDLDNARSQVEENNQTNAKEAIEKLFKDDTHTSLADKVDQKAIDDAQQALDKVRDKDVKASDQKTLYKAQNIINGQKATETLFSDKDKQVVKPGVDQQVIDDTQSVVDKMPAGPAKDQAQEDLNKAQEQVDRRNETAAKEATDKLFKDESHTSLADKVDQKAIDDAQQALDKVRDKDVKAKGQAAVDQAQKLLKAKEAVDGLFTDTSHTVLKPETNQEALDAVKTQVSELAEGADKVAFGKALDKAQRILDGQKATETLFSDEDKQVVKPGVDQQVIDDAQSVVDKMPAGPAKDQAQKDLNKAQEQVDRKNETAAKEAGDKLFKDESHTSLADKVDQKAIDDAQQALDKVRDQDVKAKGQAAVDQAQKILKAKEAVDGLFTDTSHTALKPETNQEAVDVVKTQVSELAEGADKVAFNKALDKAQRILDGQKATETLFSDEDKQVVKPGVDQQVIDDTQSVVDKMPNGPARDQAQKDLDKARSQVEENNQTAAKEAIEKLFKDDTHTSLTDKVDQKSIDDAQQTLDKVRDKDVKASDQKTLDKAQRILDGQKATETLFSDEDKQIVKPGVDQQVIDDTQFVVDKMPKGPAKDQAQKDLNKAQEQVDRKNETAAKEATDKLFKDESHTSLADRVDQKVIDDAQKALDKVRDKAVKAKHQQTIDQAQKLLKAKEAVDGLFTDTSHTALKPETNQEAVDAVKTQVSELAEGADKVAFNKALDKAQHILDGQKAVETLFSDKDKQVVKPSVDQQVIDDTQSVVDKMPKGPAKDQAQKDLNKAQEQVDRKNETAAQEATDKLFKDKSHTSLADKVDQKAIDDAQQALDKVRDKDVKAKGQKDLDNAQSLFNGQKGTETLFSDKDKQVVKPGVDQQVIDDTQSVVDKMPKGPAKDQAQKDLNKAQEQVDRKNETAAQEATDKLFKDESHTSLADKVDQKVIDDAQKALDKVRDKDVKAKHQQTVDQAQKLLKAKEAVDGLFTDTSHTALKPEINQEALDAVKTQVSELAEGADKVAFNKALDKAQRILDGQKAIETLFSDKDKQVVKPSVDQQVIDDTQTKVDKLPKGSAKDQAQKDLNKAQEQVDRKNETAAKEAGDKLFKDESHTSLADKVDQKAIDDAQKALDKVRDQDVKAKGQKEIDIAQSLLNRDKDTKKLFVKNDETTYKPDVYQTGFDDTHTAADKIPAQAIIEPRFKDNKQTGLEAIVDQKSTETTPEAKDNKDLKANTNKTQIVDSKSEDGKSAQESSGLTNKLAFAALFAALGSSIIIVGMRRSRKKDDETTYED